MELQPGQVNWGEINPQVMPGAVRMWIWDAFAAGNNYVCTYRFKQPLFGFEQFHHGILKTDGETLSQGGKEYVQFIEEYNNIKNELDNDAELPAHLKEINTAILWTHDNRWNLNIDNRTSKWNTMQELYKYFDIARSVGAPIELVDKNTPLDEFKVLIVPAYQILEKETVDKWEQFVENGGSLVLTYRTGIKDKNNHLWEGRWAEPINDLIGANIEFYDLLPNDVSGEVSYNDDTFKWEIWADILSPGNNTEVLATYADQYYKGKAAVVSRKIGKGTVTYIGVATKSGNLEKNIIRQAYREVSDQIFDLPVGVYVHWRDGIYVAVNYSSRVHELDINEKPKFLLGTKKIAPGGVCIWK